MALFEQFQPLSLFLQTAAVDGMHGTAAEGRIAGAEDHARIEQIGVQAVRGQTGPLEQPGDAGHVVRGEPDDLEEIRLSHP